MNRSVAFSPAMNLEKILSRKERDEAYDMGVAFDAVYRARGYKETYGYDLTPEQSREYHGMSAVSERLVAKVTNRRWISAMAGLTDIPGAGDVERGINVRWTRLAKGNLIVYKEDTEPKYVLVIGADRYSLRIHGWMRLEDAQLREYWRRKRRDKWDGEGRRYAAYFVPQTASPWRNIVELFA